MNLLDLIFPKSCLECGKNGKYICLDCESKVLDGTFDQNNFAVYRYRGVIRKAITSLKYKFAYDICDELVDCCVGRIKSSKFHDVLLVPIPLFWQKENFRGFNQSGLLAKKIADKMSWKYDPNLLIRNKNNKPQVGLKGLDRHQNMSNAFIVNPQHRSQFTFDIPLLLFDDVYTTGSTIKEAKKVLERFGFTKIYSLTVAR
jgi:ComF family protein